MAAYDYKREQKELYRPGGKPESVMVPAMHFAAVEGMGDPNEEGGAYGAALSVLYAVAYTVKMSPKAGRFIDGYFPYVVPPLEGLWWMADGADGVDCGNKSGFHWISMLRLPDFVMEGDFAWACGEAARKKGLDTSCARFFTLDEGLCVQCLHTGSYDDEPATVAKMDALLLREGYRKDISQTRRHHEIYLSDPRRTAPEKRRTVIRHPIA